MIGSYPSPVERSERLSTARCSLWIKHDEATSTIYGGNKVRKLERILEAARLAEASRIVTFGAAGSHHVLATSIHGGRAGFSVAAVLTPQPWTAHAEANLRSALSWGLEAWPAPRMTRVLSALARQTRRGDFLVAPGGSNVLGTLGYVDAARELAMQVAEGSLPAPEVVVVALGSAGTAAGLLGGFAALGFESRIVGVRVVSPWLAGCSRTVALAAAALRSEGGRVPWGRLWRSLTVEGRYLGRGYGWASLAGERALREAAGAGMFLEPTYTAKAFASALEHVRSGLFRNVLYWHTVARGRPPEGPLAARLPSALPEPLAALFLGRPASGGPPGRTDSS